MDVSGPVLRRNNSSLRDVPPADGGPRPRVPMLGSRVRCVIGLSDVFMPNEVAVFLSADRSRLKITWIRNRNLFFL